MHSFLSVEWVFLFRKWKNECAMPQLERNLQNLVIVFSKLQYPEKSWHLIYRIIQ